MKERLYDEIFMRDVVINDQKKLIERQDEMIKEQEIEIKFLSVMSAGAALSSLIIIFLVVFI